MKASVYKGNNGRTDKRRKLDAYTREGQHHGRMGELKGNHDEVM